MSYRSQESTYTDGIKVKISEKYKPPRKINLALSYSQRLSLNKQIQDSMPNYTFELERSTLEYVSELKSSRKKCSEERKERLCKVREEMREKELAEEEEEEKTAEEATNVTTSNEIYLNNTMLIPTYSNILTPMPLNTPLHSYSVVQKTPFNISDFEDDTSSPFDNVALKSINDMEELAKVLKPGDSYKPPGNAYEQANAYSSYMQNQMMGYGQYSNNYNIPSTVSYVPPASTYSQMNGYYYTSPDVVSQSFRGATSYHYKIPEVSHSSMHDSTSQPVKNCKSVPDIIKSLEEELRNTHFEADAVSKSVPTPTRPKSIDAVYPKPKVKESRNDPLADLDAKQKELCRSIGSMGFPLDRVVRVFRLVGDDQKKIVDHLLAMSELLDLGFSEKDVSGALLQFDNDRDKALDKLVS